MISELLNVCSINKVIWIWICRGLDFEILTPSKEMQIRLTIVGTLSGCFLCGLGSWRSAAPGFTGLAHSLSRSEEAPEGSDTPDSSGTHPIQGAGTVWRSTPRSASPQCLVSGRNSLSSGFWLLRHIFRRRCLSPDFPLQTSTSLPRKWNDGVLGLFCAHCLG